MLNRTISFDSVGPKIKHMSVDLKFEAHPESAPGSFYVVNGECLACGMPHVVAPDLVGWAEGNRYHCVWKKQPHTPAEIERAIAVLESQDLECHRYAGTDPEILRRAPSNCCDNALHTGNLTSTDLTELKAPEFALIEHPPTWVTKLWKKLVQSRQR